MAADPIAPLEMGCFREDLGAWVRASGAFPGLPRPALFLDRDGVLVEDTGHLGRAADVVMIPGAAEIVALANRSGVPVIEVTNQAGIAKAYYDWQGFLAVEETLTRHLMREAATIDAVLACPYHRDGNPPWKHPAHPARKPRPGMLLAAAELLNLDLAQSWIVGDKTSDLLAGFHAGLRGGVHVLTGHGRDHRRKAVEENPAGFELRLADSVREVAPLIQSLSALISPTTA
jgi:D-glycero-D-manno-heptose 1,7-bisphosphate phosphatase